MSLLHRLFGDSGDRILAEFQPLISRVNAQEEEAAKLSLEALREKTLVFRKRLSSGETLDDILPEAFAIVREAAKRTLRERHFDVQLVGGMVLHRGEVAEMKTGEGKTLVATLPAYVNALPGHGVHIVTVNDYLARRDAVWMGQVFDLLGLSVSVINHETSYRYDTSHVSLVSKDKERDIVGSFKIVYDFLKPCTRKEAYETDITYGTNSEFGFDYLRDNLVYHPSALVQRGFNYAIVDEVDSILIDEARTPLIISASIGEKESLYPLFAKISQGFSEGTHYTVDHKLHTISLLETGIEEVEKALGVDNIYTDKGVKYVHHLETAVRAKALFEKERDYVVKDGEVIIVDQFTGRLQPGRRWSEGLHQAIEAKEGVQIKEESRTMASITYQNYFRMYKKLSGMTGTALTSAEEFYKVYGRQTRAIPTHRPNQRIDNEDLIFQTEKGKFIAATKKVKELHVKGQPVLIGTASIEKNEALSAYLRREGIPFEMLNAQNHEREGEIIAQAGKKGSVVVATNLAGRGVDIKLGGATVGKEEYEKIKSLGGLYVLGTERHEARRIDNQLRGRSARQGDPGETQVYVSLEDPLMKIFAPDAIKNMMGRFGIPEDEPIENKFVTRAIESAQTKIEGFNFDARKHLLEYDDVMNHQRKTIYGKRRALLLGTRDDLEKMQEGILSEGDEREKLKAVISEKKKALGEERFAELFRAVSLQAIDMLWVEHLEVMEYMRGSVNLRAYGQRDPLVEYKKEGLRLFKELEHSIDEQILSILPRVTIEPRQDHEVVREVFQKGLQSKGGSGKVGRNDPCPCGATKPDGRPMKYKHCHGKDI